MTPLQWQQHAHQCREVAARINDDVGRQILLEAAEDYLAIAERERRLAAVFPCVFTAMPAAGRGAQSGGL